MNTNSKKLILGGLILVFLIAVGILTTLVISMDLRVGEFSSNRSFFCLGSSETKNGGKNGECFLEDTYSCKGIYSETNSSGNSTFELPCVCTDAEGVKRTGIITNEKCYMLEFK